MRIEFTGEDLSRVGVRVQNIEELAMEGQLNPGEVRKILAMIQTEVAAINKLLYDKYRARFSGDESPKAA